MIHLILYDISDDKIRTKVAQRLVAAGYERIQLSIFVGDFHPNNKLWQEIKNWLKVEPSAKLYAIKVSKHNFKKMSTIGAVNFDIDFLLGLKNSIFI